jgi:phosphopentomutase
LINIRRILLVVFDGFGIGPLPEKKYTFIPNSFKHVYESVGDLYLPNFERLGLGNLTNSIKGTENYPVIGRSRQQSKFCESFAAHWEMSGAIVNSGVAFPKGIPQNIIRVVEGKIGKKIIGNSTLYPYLDQVDSEIIVEHLRTGNPILMTMPYEETITTFALFFSNELYNESSIKEIAVKAKEALSEFPEVGRLVVRLFLHKEGKISLCNERHDFANFIPPEPSILNKIILSGRETVATGKIGGLFNDIGFTKVKKSWMSEKIWEDTISSFISISEGLVWANLNDLDRPYGHNRDILGWSKALESFDYNIGCLMEKINEDDLLIITGDHGCDPTLLGEHTFEWNPLILFNPNIRPTSLGDVNHIDIARTIAELWNLDFDNGGISFADKINFTVNV